jgi:hypothetical protein
MSWSTLNLLWLIPVGSGTIFVAAVLLHAVWRSRWSHRRDGEGQGFQHSYAASKPSRTENS